VARKKRIKLNAQEISELIKRNQGNVTVTAEDLGIARLTLYQWIKKHGLNLTFYDNKQ
jgi:transcriptional regulator of acetoin/glycerol metabolism